MARPAGHVFGMALSTGTTMIALQRQSIRSLIRIVTMLAALTSLLLTMWTPSLGAAYAEGNGNPPPNTCDKAYPDLVKIDTGLGDVHDTAKGSSSPGATTAPHGDDSVDYRSPTATPSSCASRAATAPRCRPCTRT